MESFYLNQKQSDDFNPKTAKTGKYILRRKNGSKRVVTVNNDQSLADASQQEECEVNNIMDKYLKTGQVTHLQSLHGQFADVSEIPDLHTALTQVTQAQTTFNLLPAELRERFENSPVKMIAFLSDPRNDQEAISLNLKTPNTQTPAPVPEPVPTPSPSINATLPPNPPKPQT